jgi:Domain of Unknown Function (DUF1259)
MREVHHVGKGFSDYRRHMCVHIFRFSPGPKPTKTSMDWKDVDAAMGRPGQDQPDGTHKFSLPRKDLNITLNGVPVKAGLALGSWVAFKSTTQGNAMVMGDLVLTEDEVGPVMEELQSGGIEITALYNHVIGESPHVMYMHIHAMGNAASLGKAIHGAVAKTKTPDASSRRRRLISISIPNRSTRFSGAAAKITEVSTRLPSHAQNALLQTVC